METTNTKINNTNNAVLVMQDLWTPQFCLTVFLLSLWKCVFVGRNQWLMYKPLLLKRKVKSHHTL